MFGSVFLSYIIYKQNYTLFSEEGVYKSSPACPGAKFGVRSQVKYAKITEDKILLVTEPKNGLQDLIVLDYCSGKILSRSEIKINKNHVNENEEVPEDEGPDSTKKSLTG